ncbi:MAG: ribbon-helix-helix domain-containing protein [Deltaproteobacteria bacterium]|nr:ribbon-helix-helix domain-containing protein [Deltaproteobacteria bacterium]
MKKVLFNLTEDQYKRLEALAKKQGVTKSEALRRALELYQLFRQTEKEGGEWRKKSKDGQETIMQVL